MKVVQEGPLTWSEGVSSGIELAAQGCGCTASWLAGPDG